MVSGTSVCRNMYTYMYIAEVRGTGLTGHNVTNLNLSAMPRRSRHGALNEIQLCGQFVPSARAGSIRV